MGTHRTTTKIFAAVLLSGALVLAGPAGIALAKNNQGGNSQGGNSQGGNSQGSNSQGQDHNSQ